MKSIRSLAMLTVSLVTSVLFAANASFSDPISSAARASASVARATVSADVPHDLCSRLLCE